jgi:hypothetical protein
MSRTYVAVLAAAAVLLLGIGLVYGRITDDPISRASFETGSSQVVNVARENTMPSGGGADLPPSMVPADMRPPDFAFGAQERLMVGAPFGGLEGVHLTSAPEWAERQQVFTRSASAPSREGGRDVAIISSIKYLGGGNRLTVTYGVPEAEYWAGLLQHDGDETLDDGTAVFAHVVEGEMGSESVVFLAKREAYIISVSSNLPLDEVRAYADQLKVPRESTVE